MSAPKITVGMDEKAVERLLGKPKSRRSAGAVLGGMAKNASQVLGQLGAGASKEYAIYDHAAGTYQLVFQGGKVVEVYTQPD